MATMEWWRRVDSARRFGAVPAVGGLTHDSRTVRPGDAFAALPGRKTDGHDFLESVLAAGAAAAVVQADREAKWQPLQGRLPLVVVPDTRAALGPLAAAVYGDPSRKLRLIGVTGTDGKTTTSHLVAHILDTCGLGGGYLSSAGFDCGEGFELNATHMTTLEATSIQSLLARAVQNGKASMAVEASSEGLAQHRLDGCEFDVAVFTNLTRDHLDFHGSMERYLAAKGILFEMLERPSAKQFTRAAVLNADDPACEYLRGRSRAPVLTYGTSAADFNASAIAADGFGLSFNLRHDGRELPARVPLLGAFNAYNSLAAIAVASSQGIEVSQAVAALAGFTGVPGRLERIEAGQPFAVFVDIASTAAALENVLKALRPATSGRLWVVFGAAGGRDPIRRSSMGEVAARLADRCVLTNEDPRDEDPNAIIAAIAGAIIAAGRAEGSDFVRIPDRRAAIRHAFEHAGPGDTVLLAGKATETTMVFGQDALPWDERTVARELLAN
jgi:UDP-N-acetylmuramoyl-L-alanyl-D-glutamate--2,6-diaminopimelate ligase